MSGSSYFETAALVKVRVEINETNYVTKMFPANTWNIGSPTIYELKQGTGRRNKGLNVFVESLNLAQLFII